MKFYVKPKKPESDDELMHFGRLGQKSGVHKFGRWQRQAKYANGQPDPDADSSEKDQEVRKIVDDSAEEVSADHSQESQKRRDEAVKSRGKTRANGNWPLDRQRAIRDARTKLYETKPSALRELDRAINKDEFQLDFLEAIQNSKIEYDGDAQAIAIEYAYYLLDPEDYMKNRELPYA